MTEYRIVKVTEGGKVRYEIESRIGRLGKSVLWYPVWGDFRTLRAARKFRDSLAKMEKDRLEATRKVVD